MPSSAMMKLTAVKGTMFSCGWPPPLAPAAPPWKAVVGDPEEYLSCPAGAQMPPAGEAWLGAADEALGVWLWEGMVAAVTVTVSAPAASP